MYIYKPFYFPDINNQIKLGKAEGDEIKQEQSAIPNHNNVFVGCMEKWLFFIGEK